MLAQNNKYINEASETIYQLTREEQIRLQCEAREDYYRRQRSWDDRIAKAMKIEAEHDRLTADNDKLTAENKELKVTVEELTATITRQEATIQKQEAAIQKQEAAIAKQDASIAALIAAMEANGITINT